jgi:NADH:quinone reductase (non-electrogenic)
MIETKITKMLNIRFPIIQGGLQGLGTSALVSAVSNAGGLGLITAGSYETKQEMMQDIEVTKKLTNNPFGVNITIGIRKPMDEFVDGAIEAGVKVVFTSGNNPEKYMDKLKATGIKVIHVAPSARFAKKAESLGCDAVVVNGYECGGHPGKDDTTSLTIVQKVVNELSIPVIAAGGFSTGRSVLAAMALGADGVQMGTRFLMSSENRLHQNIKNYLMCMQETDTLMVKKSIGKKARVLKTELSVELATLEKQGATLEEIFPYISGKSYKELIEKGDVNAGIISLGQTIGLINKVKSVEEIMDEIVDDYRSQLRRLVSR